jgi:hypothetical protein
MNTIQVWDRMINKYLIINIYTQKVISVSDRQDTNVKMLGSAK